MVTKLQVRQALRNVSSKPSVSLSAVRKARAMIALNKPAEQPVELPRDYFNKQEMQSLFMELLSKGLPEKPELDTEKFITMEDVRDIMPSTEGFVKQEDFDKFVKKLNNVLANMPIGGGGNVPLRDKVESIDQRLEALVSDLSNTLTEIASNTDNLNDLELLFERIECAFRENREQLVLLNTRAEEAWDTDITIEDTNDEVE